MTARTPIDSNVAASVAKLLSPSAILVGGQALGVWIGFFKLEADLEVPVTSEDVDFVASQNDALLIACELKGHVRVAEPFDHSPNLATVEVPGEPLGSRTIVNSRLMSVGCEAKCWICLHTPSFLLTGTRSRHLRKGCRGQVIRVVCNRQPRAILVCNR